jgi:hypothetical protein
MSGESGGGGARIERRRAGLARRRLQLETQSSDFPFFVISRRVTTDGPDSNELVADLTEKLLAGKKTEVFGFLQTLPAARAQRLKDKLIQSLKKVPATAAKPDHAALGPRPDTERPRSQMMEKKTASSDALPARPRANSVEPKRNISAGGSGSVPVSPSIGGRQTRSVCGGRYLIGECVGRGNFGKVYNALDKNTGQFVAVKEIGCSNFGKAAINAIMLEADLLSSLDHKNIVKNLEVDQTEDHIFFVMELISSGSLYDTLNKFGTLTEQLCVIYMVQVLRGLRYLHGRGLTHGDIVRRRFWVVESHPFFVLAEVSDERCFAISFLTLSRQGPTTFC